MVVDSSALVAILLGEPDGERFVRAISEDGRALVSTATLVETTIVAETRKGETAGRELDLFLHRAGVAVVAVDAVQADEARRAWRRFGKGRHPAQLNFGDCFSYALAISAGEPLLYKGGDFARTDVIPALVEPGGPALT